MIRFFQIVVLGCIGLSLAGCGAPEEDKPIWEDVKIRDIATPSQPDKPDSHLLETAKLEIYIFEIPAGNISALDDVWKILYKKPLQFNSSYALGANLFSVGFGRIQLWDKVGDLLRAADGKKINTVSMLLADRQPNNLDVAWLDKEQTVFHVSTEGPMEVTTLGPGKIALRIEAQKIPASRGVANISFQPMFLSPLRTSPISQLRARGEQTGDFVFTSTGFKLKMSPGDFLFLGPKEYVSRQATLGSLFFSRPKRKPVIITYLVLCAGITY